MAAPPTPAGPVLPLVPPVSWSKQSFGRKKKKKRIILGELGEIIISQLFLS